jgi:hypothetical protein
MRLARGLRDLPPRVPVLIGLPDYTMPGLAAMYLQGHPAWDINGTFNPPFYQRPVTDADDAPVKSPELLSGTILQRMRETYTLERFYLAPDGLNHHFRRFAPPPGLDLADAVVLLPARDTTLVDDSQDRPATGRFYVARLADQRDTLVQVDTSLGHIIVPGHRDDIGLWQREPDFAGIGHGIQAAGAHILFEVLGPVSGSRLLLDFTSGPLAGQGYALPPATVYGVGEQPLGLVGRGAGRVLSEPIEAREIDGHSYVALELNQEIAQFRSERRGAAGLYNTKLALDLRGLVGFVRNISLLTPEQAAALAPPSAVTGFPAGLRPPGLLFSGVSEDGWVADKAWFELATDLPSDRLRIKGDIASLGPALKEGTIRVSVDGAPVGQQKLIPGLIDLDLPIPPKAGPRRITLEATATDKLPAPDGRTVAFHLASVALATEAP